MNRRIEEKTYAGVLGKIIGVFWGRPIEGWSYQRIQDRFGLVDHYVYKEVGTPLIVADDDIAGTFTFFNAIEDCEDISCITAKDFGETWLDYIIENKTIFWWGGLGRSTEHTAYIRLKSGIQAPLSGSAKINGQAVAEQIGAEIFIDALAMMCPGDPEMARKLVKASASVSHDGIAVEAACFLATLEALAFEIKDVDALLDRAIELGTAEKIKEIIIEVRNECKKTRDFRKVRDWLEQSYGYDKYPGNCHVIPNFALVLASLILGEDDFAKAMQICVSCGWDTDCNAANLGCINGIRLGLESIDKSFDFRGPVADRLYNISSNGGACISDAVQQARRILNQSRRLYRMEPMEIKPRFAFEFPGSVQGFEKCPFMKNEAYLEQNMSCTENGVERCNIKNSNEIGLGNGIFLTTKNGICAVSTPTMLDLRDRQINYCLTASPTLYAGQTVTAEIEFFKQGTKAQLYVLYYDFNNKIKFIPGTIIGCEKRKNMDNRVGDEKQSKAQKYKITWKIPNLMGMPIARIGVLCTSEYDGNVAILRMLDWKGAPEYFEITGSLKNYEIGTNMALESFVSSAKQYQFDSKATFVISHPEKNGVITIGTEQWRDYSVRSTIKASIHKRWGVIGRARGHRRYYALALWDNKYAGLICKKGSEERILAVISYQYKENELYELELTMKGQKISGRIGSIELSVTDDTYLSGEAGYMVDFGTILAYGFWIEER